ncbi:MAG: hypothetical protein ABIH11_01545 [Candidatus Altiarchaeota archaeon]
MRPRLNEGVRGIVKSLPEPKPVEWLYLACGILFFYRYFFIIDDAFVYFRYVDNLVLLKIGLVYNYGEYVEAYTSPLWLLILIPFRALMLSYAKIIQTLGLSCLFLFWLGLVKLNRQLSPDGITINVPAAYLTFVFAVPYYFSSGLESPLVQLTAVAYALYFLNHESKPLQAVIGVSPLIRPEFTATALLVAVLHVLRHRRIPAAMVTVFAASMLFWLTFRVYYYAELLPNTFYLKDMWDTRQGIVFLKDTFDTYYFRWFALFFILGAIILYKHKVRFNLADRTAMVLTALVVVLYVVKIGGDHKHYRYLAFPFILITCSFSGILEHLFARLFNKKFFGFIQLAGLVFSVIVFTTYPMQLSRHPIHGDLNNYMVNLINVAWKPTDNYAVHVEDDGIEERLKFHATDRGFQYNGVRLEAHCYILYDNYYNYALNRFGVTDSILARMDCDQLRPGHKLSLTPYAVHMAGIIRDYGEPRRGMYRDAIENGTAQAWVVGNIDAIEIVEKKIYNKHDFYENLRLALNFPGKIRCLGTHMPEQNTSMRDKPPENTIE